VRFLLPAAAVRPSGGPSRAPVGIAGRPLHTETECQVAYHEKQRRDCIPVYVVDLTDPDAVTRAQDYLAEVVAAAEERHRANLAASRAALARLDHR
jgi:hypothetical protein